VKAGTQLAGFFFLDSCQRGNGKLRILLKSTTKFPRTLVPTVTRHSLDIRSIASLFFGQNCPAASYPVCQKARLFAELKHRILPKVKF
jgi:hypothetical protein